MFCTGMEHCIFLEFYSVTNVLICKYNNNKVSFEVLKVDDLTSVFLDSHCFFFIEYKTIIIKKIINIQLFTSNKPLWYISDMFHFIGCVFHF